MIYLDHRLSKILSDIRIEQARAIRRRRPDAPGSEKRLREKLGQLLINQGERLANEKPNIA